MPAALEATPDDVARHYDELDPFYRELWGEHLHHGLWVTGRESPEEAAKTLVDHVADLAEIGPGTEVCDVGCGYGATARMLAATRGARVTGVTVSAAQHRIASAHENENLRFLVTDWQRNDFPPERFDAVIAIESTEHMADRARVFAEAFRVLRPGGRLVVCAWLAGRRDGFHARTLRKIAEEGRLAGGMDTAAEYLQHIRAAGFGEARWTDESRRVRRTWRVCTMRVARRLLSDRAARAYLRDAANANRIFAATVPRIWLAYATGTMRYGVFRAVKP
jgi:tocopherol O-methyltransferase